MVIRGCSYANGESHGFEGMDALKAILADPEAIVWVDVAAASDVPVDPITQLLELHPLIAADIAERNQRAKVAEVEGTIHIVMFSISFDGRGRGARDRHRARQAVAAHRPRARLGPVRAAAAAGRRDRDAQAGARLPPVRDHRRDRGRLLPRARRDRGRDRRDPGRGDRAADDVDAGAAVHAQARADQPAPGDLTVARDLQPADQPRPGADRRRPHRLLPRRVRPPDPRDRRARHRPRARRRARSRSTSRPSTTTCRRS